MKRSRLLNLAYRRGDKLHLDNPDYLMFLKQFTLQAMKADLGRAGDITTATVLTANSTRKVQITAKEQGLIAGIEEVVWFFDQYGIKTKPHKKDGIKVKSGDVIIELVGKEFELLKTERTALNLLQRMSGIATVTNTLAKKASSVIVAATRKTPWSYLDNKAVSVGGGATHRLGLWESILIKDNHLEGLSKEVRGNVIKEALSRAWKNRHRAVFIEIEVESVRDAMVAATTFFALIEDNHEQKPCIIMLDNFSPKKVRQTVKLLKENGFYDKILLEVSGAITPINISKYHNTGVDVVSLGFLTHSAKTLDISLRFV